MGFDMNPADEDSHGECRHEIHALKAEVERLRNRLLTAAGDDLCRLSQEEIKAMSVGAVKIPPKGEFLASCERFHDQMAKEVGVATNCLTLAQLVAEEERLRTMIRKLRAAWFTQNLQRNAHEREWESEDRMLSRMNDNNKLRQKYDSQTEELLRGGNACLTPRCAHDLSKSALPDKEAL